MRIGFNEDFIRVYDGIRYLVFLALENIALFTIELDILLAKKVVLHMLFSHNYAKIKVDSYYSLPLEKPLALRNVIILIKPILVQCHISIPLKTSENQRFQGV